MAPSRRRIGDRERRSASRRDLTYPMAIELPVDGAVLACRMDDVSRSGARLVLSEPAPLPGLFVLRLDAGGRARRPCRLVWQEGGEVGVAFVGEPGA